MRVLGGQERMLGRVGILVAGYGYRTTARFRGYPGYGQVTVLNRGLLQLIGGEGSSGPISKEGFGVAGSRCLTVGSRNVASGRVTGVYGIVPYAISG